MVCTPRARGTLIMSAKLFKLGDCDISVEIAGLDMESFSLRPDTVRELAGWVINRCVQGPGFGGFATLGINNLINYVVNPATDLRAPYRRSLCPRAVISPC